MIEATLADEYGLEVAFRETTTICVERPTGRGEAVEILNTPTNPFHADLGLRIEPAAPGSGIEVVVAAGLDPRDAPLYIFKTFDAFAEHMDEYVRLALAEGLYGWQVTDCVVTLTKIGYSLADGPPSRRGPMPTARDLKRLTPLVLMQALEQAGTAVCEPVFRIAAEVPTETIGPVLAALGGLGAGATTPSTRGELSVLEATLPASRVQELRRQLPGLTGGEGVLDSEFAGYEPVTGEPAGPEAADARPAQARGVPRAGRALIQPAETSTRVSAVSGNALATGLAVAAGLAGSIQVALMSRLGERISVLGGARLLDRPDRGDRRRRSSSSRTTASALSPRPSTSRGGCSSAA